MTWRDKLELGLKDDAAFRKDNLTPDQIRGPQLPTGPGRSPEVPLARGDKTRVPPSSDDPDDDHASEDDQASRDN